jgi:polar amino acid transport system substrate-binding protein
VKKPLRTTMLAVVTLSFAAFSLTGCSNPDDPKPTDPSASASEIVIPKAETDQAAADALPQAIRDKGTMIATMSQGSPPLHFAAEDGTTTIGIDAELAVALGQAMGLDVSVSSGPFDAIIPGIAAGKFDMAVSQMSPSTERMKVLDFVDYYQSGSGIGVMPGNPQKLALDNLCGKKVGVLKGSFQDLKRLPDLSTKCTKAGKEAIIPLTYADMQAPNLALTAGRIDAVYVDGPTLAYAVQQAGQIEVLGELDVSPVSIGFKKGAGLEKSIELGLQSLEESGIYQQILDKWGVGSGAISDFAFNKAQ